MGIVIEVLVIALAVLSPWAIGAVDARAEVVLAANLVVLAVLNAIVHWRSDRLRDLTCLPGLALAGFGLIALAQNAMLPADLLARVSPQAQAARAALVPATPERVLSDPGPPVGPRAPTISLVPDATSHAAAQIAAAWLLFQVALGLRQSRGHAVVGRLGVALAIDSALLALFALAQALSWEGKIYGVRDSPVAERWFTGGPFVSHNHLAAFLNLGLGFCLARLTVGASGGRNGAPGHRGHGGGVWRPYLPFLTTAVTTLIMVGLLGSHSRTGFLAMAAAALTLAALLRPRRVPFKWGLVASLALVPVLLMTSGIGIPFARLMTLLDSSSDAYTGRLELWQNVLRACRDYPLAGAGFGTFSWAMVPYVQRDVNVFFSHAENEYLHVLLEAGVPGLALLLAALAGVLWLGLRALAAAPARGRAATAGALCGVLTLAFDGLSDFAMHIPAVAFTGVVLAAFLCRQGMRRPSRPGPPAAWRLVLSRLAALGMVALSVAVLAHEAPLARAESLIVNAGLPVPGAQVPSVGAAPQTAEVLETQLAALEQVVRLRPEWAEGRVRLGETLLGLYQATTVEWINQDEVEKAPAETAAMLQAKREAASFGSATGKSGDDAPLGSVTGTALWLHAIVHKATPEQLAAAGGITAQEPVSRFLVPAARQYLRARRSCPFDPLTHARLGSLDYLIDPAEPTVTHVRRALKLANGDGRMLEYVAALAAQVHDLALAAVCWRRALEVDRGPAAWERVADASNLVLSPEEILEKVLPPRGRLTFLFAERLLGDPEHDDIRNRYLEIALDQLSRDHDLSEAERTWTRGQVLARLGKPEAARQDMVTALYLEPLHSEWRYEYVVWLLIWDDPEEAHRQATTGTALAPQDSNMRRIADVSREALARQQGPNP